MVSTATPLYFILNLVLNKSYSQVAYKLGYDFAFLSFLSQLLGGLPLSKSLGELDLKIGEIKLPSFFRVHRAQQGRPLSYPERR